MPNNKLLGKTANLDTCLQRVRAVYGGQRSLFLQDLLKQESVLLNLQRACENAIDIANLAVAELELGVPNSSRESFEMLEEANVVSPEITSKMIGMVGFRNLIVHQYFRIDMERVCDLIETDLDDLSAFASAVLKKLW